MALTLKIMVGVSGLVIASGFLKEMDIIVQIIGFVVLLIKLIEEIFANLDRLLSIVAAKNAFKRVRREIVKIYPNLQKGNAANKGIILRLQNILDNALLRGQMYQRSDTVEDYKRLMDKLYPVNANAEPTENVVVWGARE